MLHFGRRRYRLSTKIATVVLFVISVILLISLYGRNVRGAAVPIAAATIPPEQSAVPVDNTPAPQETDSPDASNEIIYNGETFYFLQAGAFSSVEKAASTQEICRAAGCGYVLYEDNERVRVFADVFLSAEHGDDEKQQLYTEANIETYRKTQQIPGFKLRITAAQTQTAAIKAAFSTWSNLIHRAVQMCRQKAENDSWREYSQCAAQAADTLQQNTNQTENIFVQTLYSALNDIAQKTQSLANSDRQNAVEFSARMKYTVIDITLAYCNTVADIASNKLFE